MHDSVTRNVSGGRSAERLEGEDTGLGAVCDGLLLQHGVDVHGRALQRLLALRNQSAVRVIHSDSRHGGVSDAAGNTLAWLLTLSGMQCSC